MGKLTNALVLVVASISAVGLANAQQPVPLDPTPLERPIPVTVLTVHDSVALLNSVVKVIQDSGFTISNRDPRDAQIMGTKLDTGSTQNFDKILVWLERDFQEPTQFLKLYFYYGRYERVFGHDESMRIKVTTLTEDQHIGKLKQALIALTN